jgi:hypothetical protein
MQATYQKTEATVSKQMPMKNGAVTAVVVLRTVL